MFDFLLLPQNVPFSSALLLMLLIGGVEAAGLGSAAWDGGGDIAPELEAEGGGWLGLSGVPLLVLLIIALAAFALAGFALQHAALAWTGALLPAWTAAAAAALAALPASLIGAKGAARWLPRDESTAVPLDALLGRRGIIQTGAAAAGSPARARIRDGFGQSHYPLVEPNDPGERLPEGAEVLLVARDGDLFRAVAVQPDPFLRLGDLP